MLIRLALSWLDRRIDARIERDRQRQAADRALSERVDGISTALRGRIEASERAIVEKAHAKRTDTVAGALLQLDAARASLHETFDTIRSGS